MGESADWRKYKYTRMFMGTECDYCGRLSFPPEGVCPGDHKPFFELAKSVLIALRLKKVILSRLRYIGNTGKVE